VNLSELTTESADPRFAGIDVMSVGELAATMNAADATVPAAVAAALPSITAAIEAASARMETGGRLVYVGAGTPGRLGVLDASECPPTFSTPPEQVFAIIAGGESAIVSPCEGAEDDEEAGAAAVDAAGIGPLDTVVGIASSGRTPYVLAAVRRARALGALTVGLSCNAGSPLGQAAEHAIEVLVGPEVISGSTRLKAGTAQKLVLNMFSTIVMVRLGKTYGNLMVDVKASNGKLRERAVRMVRTITGAGREEALAALDANGFNVKQAVVASRFDLSPQDAAARLERAGGRLRTALGERA
jgi:N-acetylmuramic acid 6-phosphate etherase